MLKSLGEIVDTRHIYKYNKSNTQQANRNIKLNEEKLEAITLKSGTRQDCPLLPSLFYIVLQVLGKATKSDRGDINRKRRSQSIVIRV